MKADFYKVSYLFCLVAFLNLFLFQRFETVAFSLATTSVLVYIFSLFVIGNKFESQKRVVMAGTLGILLLNFILNMRAQMFVQMVLGFSIFLSIGLMLYLLSENRIFVKSLAELVLVPILLIIKYITSVFNILDNIVSGKIKLPATGKSKLTKLIPILTGLLIGIPVALILVQLFSSADPIFKSHAEGFFKYFNFKLTPEFTTRVVFSAILIGIFAPLILFKRIGEFKSLLIFLQKYSLTIPMSVVMIMVAMTIASFLIIQSPYIFANVSAETNLVKFGVATYSEYVKKGFIELIFIASIIYALVWSGLVILRNKREGLSQKILYYTQIGVLFELGVFLFSISRRVYLYQQFHGLTLIRIYGSFFLIWIFLISLTLGLRHFRTRNFVYLEVGFTAFILIIFGIFNAEKYITLKNPPHVNNRTDFVYLSRMSADGAEGWLKAFDYMKATLARNRAIGGIIERENRREIAYAGIVLNNLMRNYHRLINKYGTEEEKREYAKIVFDSIGLSEKASNTFYVSAFYANGFTQPFGSTSFYSQYAGEIRQEDSLDKLFIWNGSEASTYQFMKSELPVSGLLALQKNFFDLYYKIYSQPLNEREFDIDVSFNSPLM